jgi:hypothetical protein
MKNVFKRVVAAIANEYRYTKAFKLGPEDTVAFESGKLAFRDNIRMKNPHAPGTATHRSWRMGFAEARRRFMAW